VHEVDGGYEIHDYLDYQPSNAEILRSGSTSLRCAARTG
jgi:hypothetical protein